MIPHHQGALDMAVAELRYGSNERLRRIAQEIVVRGENYVSVLDSATYEETRRITTPNGPACRSSRPKAV